MPDECSVPIQHRWKNLLAWLEGHGFQAHNIPVECRELKRKYTAGNGLFARAACMPGSLLFVVPPTALVNKMTLKRLYPPNTPADKALTAVQLISMHLFIWRPKADGDSADPVFGPYISTLPRNFGSHPLTWLVLSKLNKTDDLHMSLLENLPPSVLVALHRIHTRFWDDWCKVQTYLEMPSIKHQVQLSHSLETLDAVVDFMWAWLNVNTRCIYYRLKHAKADADNLTMCPILDFANHTPGQANMVPVPSNPETWNTGPANPIGDGLKFVSPDNVQIKENDEVLLTYGLHSNKTLFVEYGFVNLWFEDSPSSNREVDVQDLVEGFVFTDVRLAEAVKTALISEGYWGDWTLHLTPGSAQPSWRLIIALRLYHFVVAVGSASQDIIQPWRVVVAGKRQSISCENEQSWRKTVVLLCEMLIERAKKSISSVVIQDKNGEDLWARWTWGDIQLLWREELLVARAVKDCVLRGDEF